VPFSPLASLQICRLQYSSSPEFSRSKLKLSKWPDANNKGKKVTQAIVRSGTIMEKPAILAVDDEPYNLEILEELLEDEGYSVDLAENGEDALKLLNQNPQRYHTVLLDRMMPGLDGLEVLRVMKKRPDLRFIPVIMQTAKATHKDIQDGLDNGVIYYLTKPFERSMLTKIVNTSVSAYKVHRQLSDALGRHTKSAVTRQEYTFATLEDARSIAVLLSSLCPDPHRIIPGLNELMINAIEHGNLNIGYKRKTLLLDMGTWLDEIEARLAMPEYCHRRATVSFEEGEHEYRFEIEDQGEGFDVSQFLSIDPDRAINTHGRGIVIARAISFDRLDFISPNNKVIAIVNKASVKEPYE